jgi:phosphoenolpyruvate---glycerone phosphotransferase subunit DhaM
LLISILFLYSLNNNVIALLIISHSAAIARGVKELAQQMARDKVMIAAAGGTLEGELGTSVDLISQALGELGAPDGVLVLVDMGSAVMSAEIALEMSGLPNVISRAPLVEGAIVAAVEATRSDATLAEVTAAAEQALEAKGLNATAPAAAAPVAPPAPQTAGVEATFTIANKAGLHMRPANLFIQTAQRFSSTIRARNLDRPERNDGNVKSMLDVMKLSVSTGQRIQVRAEGDDAQAAIAALQALVDDNFGEPL